MWKFLAQFGFFYAGSNVLAGIVFLLIMPFL